MFAQGWLEIVPHRRSAVCEASLSELEAVKCSELTQTVDVVDHGHPQLGHRAPVDMLERRR